MKLSQIADKIKIACTSGASDNSSSFEDWCSELGFDADSRKAEKIYRASVRQTEKLKKLLGNEYETFLNAERD